MKQLIIRLAKKKPSNQNEINSGIHLFINMLLIMGKAFKEYKDHEERLFEVKEEMIKSCDDPAKIISLEVAYRSLTDVFDFKDKNQRSYLK